MVAKSQTEQRPELLRALALEVVFDAFERELQRGQTPSIEALLKRVPADAEREVLAEFARIAAEYATRGAAQASPVKATSQDAGSRPTGNTHSIADGETRTAAGANGARPLAPLVGAFGEYEIEEPIGSGGMGTVYRARQKSIGRVVALKVLSHHSTAISNEGAKRRFLREIAAATRQVHENIVTVFDAGECEGRQFVAMQYVEGQSLRQLVGDAPLENRRAAGYLLPACRAVEAMHASGVLHRDLKPSNILVDARNDRPLIADFGLAKLLDDDGECTRSGEMFGSPPYMPPEQFIDARSVDHTADVYGLGATLYHLLTGRPPFQAATLAETIQQVVARRPVAPRLLNTAVDRDLETICLKCLEKEPQRRYATAELLAADLERYLKGKAILARPPGALERVARWSRQNRLTATLLVGVFLSLLAVIGVSSAMYVREARTGRALREANDEGRRQLSFRCVATAAIDQSEQLGSALPWLAQALTLDKSDEMRRLSDRRRIDLTLAQYPTLVRQSWNGEMKRFVIDRLGETVAAQEAENTIVVRDILTGQERSRVQLADRIGSFTVSGDGELLAITAGDGNVELIETASGRSTGVTWRCPKRVMSLQFVPNSHRLLTHDGDGVLQLWDPEQSSVKSIAELSHKTRVRTYDISADGKTIATGCTEGQVRLWNAATGEPRSESLRVIGGLHVLRISADGNFVLAFGVNSKGLLWDVLKQPASYEEWTVEGLVQDARFAPDGLTCWIADKNGVVQKRQLADQKVLVTLPSAGPIRRMEIDGSGSRLLTVHEGKIVRIVDAESGVAMTSPVLHSGDVIDARLLPDNRFIISETSGCQRIWRHTYPTRQLRSDDEHTSRTVKAGAVNATGDWMAILRINYTVDMFNLRTQEETPRPMTMRRDVYAVSWSPDGQTLATGHRDGTCQLWNVMTGEVTGVRKSIPGQPLITGGDMPAIWQIAWSPDGKFVVAITREGTLRVWNASGEILHELKSPPDTKWMQIGNIEFDSDSAKFLVNVGKEVRLYQLDRLNEAEPFRAFPSQSGLLFATFLDDDRILAVPRQGPATIWQCSSNVAEQTILGTSGSVDQKVAFDRTTKRLATFGTDRVLKVTELSPSPRGIVSIQLHERVADIAFSADGAQLNVLQEDGWLMAWDSATGEPVSPPIELGETAIAIFPQAASPRLVALFVMGQVVEFNAAESQLPDDDLANWCCLVAGHHADTLQGLVPFTKDESVRIWEEIESRRAELK